MARVQIIKKRTKKFVRFQSDMFKSVGQSWRRPRGIDNRCRRGFRSNRPLPSIGYGSDKRTKYMMPNGMRRVVIHTPKDLEILIMHKDSYAAEVGHSVGAKKRIAIVNRARELGIKLTNGHARLMVAENE